MAAARIGIAAAFFLFLPAIAAARPPGADAAFSPTSIAACGLDAGRGLPLPQGLRGICAATTSSGSVLVQRSAEGLLIASLDAASASDPSAWTVDGAGARVVFCSASLLDIATGAPTSACLAAATPVTPGPGAFAGSGTVRASLRFDSAGRTVCPTSARVRATVTSPTGDRFDLTGSIATLSDPQGAGSCGSVYDRIELDLGSAAAPPSAPENPGRIAQLDDAQWRVVEQLLALTPQDWEVVQAVVRPGTASATVAVGTPPASGPLVTDGLPDTVNTILARVNAIRSTVNALSARTPDRPDIRDLVGQVDLAGVREMLGDVRDTLRGLLDIAADLRDGYDAFDVAAFRARLHAVLTDFESASTLYQRLLCVDDPDLPIRPVRTEILGRLIDHAPGVTLYAMSKVVETLDPAWDRRIGDVVDAVPPEVTGFCNEGLRAPGTPRANTASAVCNALRPKDVGTSLALVKAKIAEGLLIFRFAKNHTPDEIQAVAGVEAVAGGTAGTKVKNPAAEALAQWIERLSNLKDSVSGLADRRKDCLDADKDVEGDLEDCVKDSCVCTAPLSVLLGGEVAPTYGYVADFVGARIDQAEAAGLSGIAAARAKHDEAVDASHDGTAAGYGLLCRAYADLLVSTGGSPGTVAQPPRPRTGPGYRR